MNRQKKQLLNKTYQQFMEIALSSNNISGLKNIVDPNVMGIGTAKDEKMFTLSDLRELLKRQKKQSKGVKLSWKMKPLSRHIGADENSAVFVDDLTLNIVTGSGTIKMYIRFSVVLEYRNEKWIVVHWHVSKPENVQSEEDTYGIENWKQKSEELEKLVKERTGELMVKNRELEIESSLERVRSVAMGMKKPEDMLDVCKTIAQQLELLHVKEIRNVQTAIIFTDKGTYLNYEYYAKYNKLIATEVSYINHSMSRAFVKKMLDGPNEFFKRSLTKKKTQEWYAFQKKSTNQFADKFLITASSLNYYWYSLGPVALGISTYEALSKNEQELFVRFRNVFELSYRRFLDIEKAEAQAREARIEAALERVRSKAMAMHTSKELKEVAREMRNQFSLLGQKELETCAIHLWDESSDTFEAWAALRSTDNTGEIIESESKLKIKGIRILEESYQQYLAGKKDYVLINDVTKAKEFFNALKQVDSRAYAFLSETIKNKKPNDISAYWSVSDFPGGSLVMVTYNQPDENSRALLRRFANVFGLAFQRFRDLQKAETQARESRIQLALERVRARTMAMQKSDELSETVYILFQQFRELGENPDQATIGIINEKDWVIEYWVTMYGNQMDKVFKFSIDEPNVTNKIYEAWKENKKSLVIDLSGKALSEFMKYRAGKGGAAINPDEKRRIIHVAFFSKGLLIVQSTVERSEESIKLLERFAAVFEQTYTRFLDLQKAEAQAREAQIEAALERVRSRSIAMRKSEEIADIAGNIFSELKRLDLALNRVLIWTFNDFEKYTTWWSSNPEVESTAESYRIDYNKHPVFINYLEAWQQKKPIHLFTLSGKTKKTWEDHLFEHTEMSRLPMAVKKGMRGEDSIYTISVISDYGIMMSGSLEPLPDTSIDIIQRFGKVFQQSYTRYLDLQKAEAQAREAQIEAALERVRSRSMAMHKSDELKEVIRLVLEQFVHLKINAEHAGFYIDYKAQDDMHIWLADPNLEPFFAIIPYFDTPTWNSFLEAKAMGTAFHTDLLDFEEKNKFYNSLFKLFTIPEEAKEFYLQCKGLAVSTVLLDNVGLYIENFSAISYTDEENKILMRFGKVFQQTYTRFLDLQKAEAQSRESQIQLALERVRARTMAMQKSDELLPTADILFDQLKQLGAELQGVAFAICDKNSAMVQKWTSIGVFSHPYNIEPGEQRMYEAWKNQTGMYEEVYEGEKQKKYYELFMKIPEFRKGLQKFIDMGFPIPTWQKNYAVPFQHGYLLFIITKPFNETQIFLRFGKVFEQTYTRFLDLQKAEAQAREAQIEAALEKVRSRTLAMQKSDELAETSAVLFQQLIHLGISPNRLYIGIMKDDAGETEFWITDEDGSKVSMAYHDNLNNNPSFKKMYDGWKQQTHLPDRQEKSLVIDMKDEELQEYLNYLSSIHVPFKGGLSQKRRVQYLAYFSKGFIGMASPEPQPAETLQLLERFAYVFNLTFTRFNDLQIAEAHALQAEQDLIAIKAARKKAEETLTELQATQKQLIQSEKMASLGELTAGIAHEIQNPLNFVNNFSEVSNELIEEINEELQKGDIEEAKAIAADVKQNLEKINLHGKRAADIVKGMLQHSRKSEGKKEPTDINALADEYLRLSYHGLRAKDKSFNAEMKTDFDSSIGKINIIPQDIGRVLLNLINNAFYAASLNLPNNRDKLSKGGTLEPDAANIPTVWVSTKKEGDKILISVKDNGNGIPQKIIDKIFQPFFTTKPTGSGTGLGLSLSYDIIKAHGGEIKVDSKEGEGASFIIMLPTG